MKPTTSSREFAATTYSKTLAENAKRMADKLAPLTISAYETRWKTFVNAQKDKSGLPAQLKAMVSEMQEKAIAKELSWSTVRLYKATICYGITMTYLAKFHQTSDVYKTLKGTANFKPIKGLIFDNSLDKEFFESLYSEIKDFTLAAEDKGDSTSGGKTSSTKAKSISKEIYDIILGSSEYSGLNYDLLREFIELNCIIGLRPIEWFDLKGMTKRQFDANTHEWFDKMSPADIEVVTDKRKVLGRDNIHKGLIDIPDDASVVLIKNGKNSLGRAGIEYRVLYSSDKDFYKKVNMAQKKFVEAAEGFAINKKEEGDSSFIDETGQANVLAFSKIMQIMQRKMHYIVNKDDGIQAILKKSHNKMLAQKKFVDKMDDVTFEAFKATMPIKSPTIYSTRHQAVANAKEAGLSSVAIAAMFGHSSVITAARHYGKAVSGTGSSKVRPSEQNMDSVLLGVTDDQIRFMTENSMYIQKDQKLEQVKAKGNEPAAYDDFSL